MRRKRRTLRGSVQQNTVRVRAEQSIWSSTAFRLSAVASGLMIALILIAVIWQMGWPQRLALGAQEAGLNLTKNAQFAVKDIIVEGRQQTSKETIFEALNAGSGSAILGFDPASAQTRIAKLPWVATATVERRLPDTIVVRITERVPMARWQNDGHIVVIDATGASLPDAKPDQFATLPLVVGPDAPGKTQALLNVLKEHPAVQRVVMAAVRVGERRWDLHLDQQVVARMPEKDIESALVQLTKLIVDKKVLDHDVAVIDLRVPDRLILEPLPAAKAPAGHTKL